MGAEQVHIPFYVFLKPFYLWKYKEIILVTEKCAGLINYLWTKTDIWEQGAEKIWNYGRNNMLIEKTK